MRNCYTEYTCNLHACLPSVHLPPLLSRQQPASLPTRYWKSPEDLYSMAPRLLPSKLFLIRDMVQSQSVTISQMAVAAECSEPNVKNIRRNLRLFGSFHAPPNRIGRRRSITPPMLEALCDHLLEKPGLYLVIEYSE